MSKPPLPPEAVDLLSRPNPCVMATLCSDGIPVSTPTWYVRADGRVLISLDESRVRLRHLRRDPRVTLRVRARVSAWIEVERRHGWGTMKGSDQAST